MSPASYQTAPPRAASGGMAVGGYVGTNLPSHSYRPHGGEGNRTPDLVNAIHALSQLSYAPIILDARSERPPFWEHGKLSEAGNSVKLCGTAP